MPTEPMCFVLGPKCSLSRHIYTQDDKLYYKTPRMHQLDDDVGDLLASIKDLQDRLIRDLTAFILDEEVGR